MDVDRRRLRETKERKLVKVALARAAVDDGDLLADRLRDPVQHGALDLIQRHAGIDDLAADVADHPDLGDPNRLGPGRGQVDDFREVPPVTEVECYPPAAS